MDYSEKNNKELKIELEDIKLLNENLLKKQDDLKYTNQRNIQLFEAISEGIIIVDKYGVIQMVNKKTESLFGYDRDELVNSKLELLIPSDLRDQHIKHRDKFLLNPETRRMGIGRHLYGLRKDRSQFPVEIGLNYAEIEGKNLVIAVITDITKRMEVEQALVDSELRWQFAIEGKGDGLWDWNVATNEVYFSKQWKAMLGYEDNEIKNSFDEWKKLVHTDDMESAVENINKHVNNETEVYEIAHRLLCKDGSYKWILSRGKIMTRNDKGDPIRFIGTHTDITEQKNAEEALKKSEENLREANNTKDKFFSIIAHDLKNPLGSFRDVTALMVESYDDFTEEDKIEFITLMSQSSKQLYELLENLLQWARSQTGKIQFNPEKMEFCSLIKSNIGLLTMHAEKKKISLFCDANDEIFGNGDPNMITTVIRNLASNAIKFTPEGGEIHLNAIDAGEMVEISVNDNGVGISEEDLKKLFRIDVNHTTLGTGEEKGTGLGLILCKEFVEKNGGTIWVESELGKGTSFKFTVPKA